MFLIELTMGFVLLAPFLINGGTTVKAQIITVPMPENGTKLILNMKDRTQTLVNATTNETLSVEKFTFYKGNETSNETIPGSVGNMTSNINLTDKFKELGK
jgi:hypothetical protein